MTEQFDDQLLGEFVHNFYGYGSYGGQFWFIGMEEGGGDSFSQTCLAFRRAHFQKRINEHKPAVVVFYGLSYRKYWQAIAGVDLLPETSGVYAGRNDSTLFILARHPADRRAANEYFHQTGRLIRADIGPPNRSWT